MGDISNKARAALFAFACVAAVHADHARAQSPKCPPCSAGAVVENGATETARLTVGALTRMTHIGSAAGDINFWQGSDGKLYRSSDAGFDESKLDVRRFTLVSGDLVLQKPDGQLVVYRSQPQATKPPLSTTEDLETSPIIGLRRYGQVSFLEPYFRQIMQTAEQERAYGSLDALKAIIVRTLPSDMKSSVSDTEQNVKRTVLAIQAGLKAGKEAATAHYSKDLAKVAEYALTGTISGVTPAEKKAWADLGICVAVAHAQGASNPASTCTPKFTK